MSIHCGNKSIDSCQYTSGDLNEYYHGYTVPYREQLLEKPYEAQLRVSRAICEFILSNYLN
jgi:hypothetical protein